MMAICGRSQQQNGSSIYEGYQSGKQKIPKHCFSASTLHLLPQPIIKHSISIATPTKQYPNPKNLQRPSISYLQTHQMLKLFFSYFLFLQQSRINCSSESDFPLQFLCSSMKKAEGLTIKKLKLQDYEVGRVLGKGGFGKVKVAKNKKTGKYVALKLLNKHEIMKAQQIDHVYNENFVHSQITHPFIVTFEGLAQDSKHLYLVLELINGGELFTYLRNVESFTTDQARFYAATVASCFEYLHSKNIIFRDLKPENLLIGNDGYLKLTDFGFAKFLTEGRTFTICGTPEYIAPEVILNQGHGKAVDWWTLGVLIYEMHAGIDPFNDDDPMGIYKNILRGKISFPSTFDKDAKSLVKHLLVADLSKRYGNLKDGVNDIKKHRWFNSFSWDDLLKKKMKPAYVPTVKSLGDVSNFQEYPDSGTSSAVEIKANIDPFLTW